VTPVTRLTFAMLAAAIALMPGVAARQASVSPDTVWVTTTVRDKDGRLATDLTKADFEIRDNGTVRDITVFRSDPIPFAVVIMIDISGSMEGNWPIVRRGLEQVIARFQPGDRVLIGGFDGLPWIGTRFSSDRKTLLRSLADVIGGSPNLCTGTWTDVPSLRRGLLDHAGTAVWDGLACAINAAASDAETPHRVVLLISDGKNNNSSVTQGEAIHQANEAGVIVYSVGMVGSEGLAEGDLRAIAEHTGGGYYFLQDKDDAFAQIVDELRHQYVLGFAPAPGETRHQISVTSKWSNMTTRSRRIYLGVVPVEPAQVASALTPPVSNPTAPTPPPAATASSAAVAAIENFTYTSHPMGRVPRLTIAQLQQMLTDLRSVAPAWVRAAPESDQPRRRLGVATFVLDVLYSQTDPYLWDDGQPAAELMEWAAASFRNAPRIQAERAWYLAAMALLERSTASAGMERIVNQARNRFPADERWVLAAGIAAELRTWPQDRDQPGFAVDVVTRTQIQFRYEEALALPSVRQEAAVRLGFFALRRGLTDIALTRFDQAGVPEDPYLRYWLHLFRGRALERLKRLDEAIVSYERALETVPYAQSGVSALGAALVMAQRTADAARLVHRAMTVTPPGDPWTIYADPDWRHWPSLAAALRKALDQ
jgi:VWFA-related protein